MKAFSFEHLIMKFTEMAETNLRDWFKFTCHFLSLSRVYKYVLFIYYLCITYTYL